MARRRLAWRWVARRRLGLARAGNRCGPRLRFGERSGLGPRLGLGTRLGSRLELCGLGRLHEMASGLDRLGMAGRPGERLLVSWNDCQLDDIPVQDQTASAC